MNQYDDGSFGAIFPVKEMLEYLNKGIPEGLKCTHWGTEKELEDIKKGKQAEVNALKDRVDNLEAELHGGIVRVSPEILKIIK